MEVIIWAYFSVAGLFFLSGLYAALDDPMLTWGVKVFFSAAMAIFWLPLIIYFSLSFLCWIGKKR